MLSAQQATAESCETPRLIDWGENLVGICLPVCGGSLEFDWRGEQMDIAVKEGFACTELALWNPAEELSADNIIWIESRLETQVRVIRAHMKR